MSIETTFDPAGEEIIRAADNVRPIENFPKTMVVVFSVKFRDLLLKIFPAEEIGFLVAGGQALPIHRFTYREAEMGFFASPIGGAASAALLEELIALGAEKFLYFGSCGALLFCFWMSIRDTTIGWDLQQQIIEVFAACLTNRELRSINRHGPCAQHSDTPGLIISPGLIAFFISDI